MVRVAAPLPPAVARCVAATDQYYSARLLKYGATPLGVDWSCAPTQQLRFVQLLKLLGKRRKFSLNDLGCGYGALLAFLEMRHPSWQVDYAGVDLSSVMVAKAAELWGHRPSCSFEVGFQCQRVADFSVASGIFNVRLDMKPNDWASFIASTLADMHASSRKGFAVNFLEPARPGSTPVPELYRAPLRKWARYCEQRFGSRTEIVRGYGMREYTLLAVKNSGKA
ncbi:MAG: class I SAM-dependent methyltransferase [Comamonadaceae bacterium]|nr:MAG: class I SAM-dependent methyltransferase [Comamonadaceae bacterium]